MIMDLNKPLSITLFLACNSTFTVCVVDISDGNNDGAITVLSNQTYIFCLADNKTGKKN